MVLRDSGEVCGAIHLAMHKAEDRAELGYWVGVPFWGKGYCTEAVLALTRWAFDVLHVHRLFAHHFTRNPASGRVLAKAGFRHEGTLRDHVIKWNRFEGIECYGLLREERNLGVGDGAFLPDHSNGIA
jgi:RimJ/RimL family protein N-acetyltransferase